jgi:hypothetical protein
MIMVMMPRKVDVSLLGLYELKSNTCIYRQARALSSRRNAERYVFSGN